MCDGSALAVLWRTDSFAHTAKRASPHQFAERTTMTEDKQTPLDEPTVAPPAEGPRVGRRHRRWPWVVAAVVLSPIAVVALWTVIALAYTYSHGDRAGYIQKFSRKGAEAQSNRKVRHDRLNAFLNRCNLRNLWMVICTRRTQPVAVRRL